jgi:hypothetical protein
LANGASSRKIRKGKGFDAYGYDISEKAMARVETNFGIKKANNFGDCDVLIISRQTLVSRKQTTLAIVMF